MKTTRRFRKTTAFATALSFGSTVLFAEPAWGQAAPAPTATPAVRPPVVTMTPAASRLQIEHDPLVCVTTVVAPVVEAKVAPGPDMSVSRVFFRQAGTPYYYYVLMSGPPPALAGTIPRPLPELKAMDYYVQATDKVSLSRKTPDYAPPVVPGTTCKVKGVAVGKDGAGLTVGMTDANAPVIPPGFNKDDIAKIILVSGAVVTTAAALATSGGGTGGSTGAGTGTAAGAGAAGAGAAAGAGTAAAAGGGGISSTVLIVGGIAVAGGVGAAIAVAGSNDNTNTPNAPTVTRTPTVTPIPNRFVQVEVTWSGPGNVDIQLFDPSSQQPTNIQRIPAGCESTGPRTERAILQGLDLPTGTWQVRLVGVSCPEGNANPIEAILNVATDLGPKGSCANQFIAVPVPGTVDGCSFTLP